MPTVRDILGDEFATLQGQGKTDNEIVAIAKQKFKNPPQQQTPQIDLTPKDESTTYVHKSVPFIGGQETPAWFRGESGNGVLDFAGDVARGAGTNALNYVNLAYKLGGTDNTLVNKVLQKNEAITEKHKAQGRTPEREEEVKVLQDAYTKAETFGEKFSAGLDTVTDTLTNPAEWQIGSFIGENIDPINLLPAGKGLLAGATIGALTNGVQAGSFAMARNDKTTLDAGVEAALGFTAGGILGGATGALTKKAGVSTKTSDYDAAMNGLGGEEQHPQSAYERGNKNSNTHTDKNGMVRFNFKQAASEKTYDTFAKMIQAEEQSIIDVDVIVKEIGYEMELKGATPAEIELAVEQKLLPSPQAQTISNVLNDGAPITPRLTGLNMQKAILNSIENSKKTKQEFYQSMLIHGATEEHALIATKAYDTKEIAEYSTWAHDKLTSNMEKVVDLDEVKVEVEKDILKSTINTQKDNSFDLAHDALPIQETRTTTQQSALFGNEQQLFDVPSETKLVTPKWAEPLVNGTTKYEDIVKEITNAKNGDKPTALAKRAMAAMAKEELGTLSTHDRFNEVLDMTRHIEGTQSPQRLESSKKVTTVDAPSEFLTLKDQATYSKNYQYDFTLTKPRVKRIESNKATLQDIQHLKADLDMIENNPTYALPTQEELRATYEAQVLNPDTIFDYAAFDKLEQKFDPETYAEKQEMFGETTKENTDDTNYTRDLATDIQSPATTNNTNAAVNANDRRTNEQDPGQTATQNAGDELLQQSDSSTSNDTAPLFGERSDTELHQQNAAEPLDTSTSRDQLGTRSSGIDGDGIQSEQRGQASTSQEPEQKSQQRSDASVESSDRSLEERKALQQEAEYLDIEASNPQNIHDTLPMLLQDQREDVVKAETRFFENDARGMLYSNGTGTGKTFTGLGIVKRFERMGKKDVVILVPSEAKALDWIEDAQHLGLNVRKLKDTKDSGAGDIVVTTYENLRDNKELMARDIDLLVADESHKIMGNKDGKHTANLSAVQALTNHVRMAKQRAREEFAERNEAHQKKMNSDKELSREEMSLIVKEALQYKEEELQFAMDLNNKTKTVFLSASPFASHKSLRYADDFLFNFDKDKWAESEHRSYNSGSDEDLFFMQNFGYTMRYNKLTRPDAEVNVDLMERAYAEKMRESGAMSGRALKVDKDYQRAFVLVDSEIGTKIDNGFERLNDDDGFKNLRQIMRASYMDTVSLMESIKASEAVQRIKDHLAANRKVVVYHTFVDAMPKHPFKFDALINKAIAADETGTLNKTLRAEYDAYKTKYSDLYNMDLGELDTPTSIISNAFGDDVVMFNRLAGSKKSANKDKFNNNEVDIIMVNESGKEGISLHDKNGDKQRVLINLTLPIKPIDMIQVEGRIYRTGQKSDAIFEYLTLHTNFEKRYFGSNINQRVATVENLAMGDSSRALRTAIKNGYMDADTIDAKDLHGVGGKEFDMRAEGDTATGDPFTYAKSLYFGKKKGRQNNKGNDFFATPDPLGLKMVEWADIKPNDKVLEPSAGVGAIGKWFPADSVNHFVEQSGELFSDLGIAVSGKVQHMSFENLDIMNKYDAIVMNPPFGRASVTAIAHLQKAMKHTSKNGRIVLLAPNNMMEKASFKKMYDDKEFNGWELSKIVGLPEVTFSRAGTKVNTKVYIFDKTNNTKDSFLISESYPYDIKAETINDFFDEIEGFEVEGRNTKSVEEVEQEIAVSISGDTPLNIGVFKHTKTQEDMTVVTLADRVSKEEYKVFAGEIKQYGGYYSRYAKGFLFKTEAGAQTFKNGVNDGSVKLNAMFIPYADKIADMIVNFDKYADKAYDASSNFVRDLDADGIPKAVRESKNATHAMANNVFGWLRDNMVLGGGRANHYIDVLRDYTDMKGRIAQDALTTRDALKHLSEDDSADLVRALGGDLPVEELATGMRPIYEKFRKLIDTQTRALVEAGALDEKYLKEDYIKRYYFEHIAKEKSFVNMKGSAANSEKFARGDLDLDDRIAMGQVEDAGYVVAKTIMEQKDQLNRATLFKRIADEIASDELHDGYVQVPDAKLGVINKWGALNGKYVPKQVFDDLRGAAKMFDDMTGIEQIVATWFSTIQHIKTNMTVKNVGTHVYNVLSNGYIAYLDGHMTELGRVIKDPKLYKELHDEANRFGLDSMLDDLEGIAGITEHSKSGVLATILKNAYMAEGTKVGDAMRKAYAHEDAVFKIAAYLKRKEAMQLEKFLDANPTVKAEFDGGVVNGYMVSKRYEKDIKNIALSEDEMQLAFRGVDEVYVNYSTPLPTGVKNLDRSGLFPFMHYTWKATPIFLKQMMRHPYKVGLLHVMAGSYGLSKIWGEQDEREEVTPEWMNEGFNMLGVDNFTEVRESEYLNIGRSVPAMRFMNKSPVSIFLGMDGGILANMFGITMQGRDNKGYSVDGGKYDSTSVKVAKRASALAEQAMPPLFPALPLVIRPKTDSRGRAVKDTTEVVAFGGRYFQKAYDALGGKKDKRDNPLEITDVAKQAVGAKLQKVDKLMYAQKSVNAARKLYEREHNMAKNSGDRNSAAKKYRIKVREIKKQLPANDVNKLKVKTKPAGASRAKVGKVFSPTKSFIKL